MKVTVCFFLLILAGCREIYNPPVLNNPPDILVVDGFLNGGPDSTFIKLSHTRSMADTGHSRPELYARLFVESDQNESVQLLELGEGLYGGRLNLLQNSLYRLSILMNDGRQFSSDFVPVLQTPAIDSLSWEQDSSDVRFYLTTHDPLNKTIYYRWQFDEIWQYTTYLNSNFDYKDGMAVPRRPEEQIHNCWKYDTSSAVFLANSAGLSQDIISHFQFNTVSKFTEKIAVRYSVQMSQFALTRDQYSYWTELKKNSEQTGSIFDPQPSALKSNIHCVSNVNEPVLGYICASTVQKKTLLVDGREMTNYNYVPYFLPCSKLGDVTVGISLQDQPRVYEYLLMPNHLFTLWYPDVNNTAVLAQNFCVDCREHGGTTRKPDFWP